MADQQMGKAWQTRRSFLQGAGGLALGGLASTCKAQNEQNRQRKFARFFSRAARLAISRGLEYLVTSQNEDGSFGKGPYARNVAVCALSGMSLLAGGSTPGRGLYGRQIEKCVSFILLNTRESGFIQYPEATSRGPMYGHGFATLFLSEVYGMSRNPDLRQKLSGAVLLILNSQNQEGGWRYEPRRNEADISVTVCQVMALRAAKNAGLYVPNDVINRATGYVKECQNEDGGFMYMSNRAGESEFPRSAAALVALYSAGIYDGDEVLHGLEYLNQFLPTIPEYGRQGYYFYGQYYAAQAMWHAGGKYWENWYAAIRDVLVEKQASDASWFDVIGPEYGTAMACLVLQMPNNYLPIFRK